MILNNEDSDRDTMFFIRNGRCSGGRRTAVQEVRAGHQPLGLGGVDADVACGHLSSAGFRRRPSRRRPLRCYEGRPIFYYFLFLKNSIYTARVEI